MAHREQVLAADGEQNARLDAELAHIMQVAQQAADLEVARIAALAKAIQKEATEATLAKAREEALRLHHQLHAELAQVQLQLAATRAATAGEGGPKSVGR